MTSDTKTCPYCAEEIKSAAVKCRFCGELLDAVGQTRSLACGVCTGAGCSDAGHKCQGRCIGCDIAPLFASEKRSQKPDWYRGKFSDAAQQAAKQEVVEYKSYKDFEKDRGKRQMDGWSVKGISDSPQRPGAVRMALISPIGAYIWKPKSRVFVIYEKGNPG